MFLNQLAPTTKEVFLKICVHAALADGVFAEEEKQLLFAYCKELDVEPHVPETPETFEELLNSLSATTSSAEKNIIVLEILGLVMIDNDYDEKEKVFIKTLAEGFEISDATVFKFIELLDAYTKIGKELYATITA